ncbi:MAG TPA: hypothetical protein VMV94_21915, partial [Phycisphaerae bacterium]|nr:hypothetical protein [Phycisphaerae bacterium]
RFIRTNPGVLRLKGGEVVIDAASEEMGICFKGFRTSYGETVGDLPQIRHSPDMAALRKYLMAMTIADPRPTEEPWVAPAEGWYK